MGAYNAGEGAEDGLAGEIFGDEVDGIAANVVGGEGAASGGAEAVADAGGGDVDGAVAPEACTQVEVNVLAVHPELGVEYAERGLRTTLEGYICEHGATVGGGGGAWAEDFLFAVVLAPVSLPDAAAVGHAVETVVVARRVEGVGAVIEHEAGGGHTCPGIAVEGVYEGSEPRGVGHGVVVEEDQDFTASFVEAGVYGCDEAVTLGAWEGDYLDFGVAEEEVVGAVGGGVVHDDGLERLGGAVGLVPHRFEAFGEEVRAVVGGDDDRHAGCRVLSFEF